MFQYTTLSVYNTKAIKGKPHPIITMTCTPAWETIVQNLLPGQTAYGRPDRRDRVFEIKLTEYCLLKTCEVTTFRVDNCNVRNFSHRVQKRGMPHAHMVVKFDGPCPDQLGEMDGWCY